MSRHTITSIMVICGLLLCSVAFVIQYAVAVQAKDTLFQEHTEASRQVAQGGTQEHPPSSLEIEHEQGALTASTSTPLEHHPAASKRETRLPVEKEVPREEFILEPIHLLLLGSGLIALGMLRNRYKKI